LQLVPSARELFGRRRHGQLVGQRHEVADGVGQGRVTHRRTVARRFRLAHGLPLEWLD
jgi:hypothetical protein